jgi:fumarylacetoacetase
MLRCVTGLTVSDLFSAARDIQAVEMQPLGPHNGKSFATTISPWVLTALALEPFTCKSPPRQSKVSYIVDSAVEQNAYDIHLSASVRSAEADSETIVCRSELRGMDWTLRDLVLQQTVNGCAIEVGDILGSGTVSGFGEGEGGSLLEINGGGKKEWTLKNGKSRTWIEDGDSVVLTGWAGEGVGFGECVGSILPAN